MEQRDSVTTNYRFLENLERELNGRYSIWMWERHNVRPYDGDFFRIYELESAGAQMRFWFELAAQYGVMPQDIHSPGRRLSTLDYVVQQSAGPIRRMHCMAGRNKCNTPGHVLGR